MHQYIYATKDSWISEITSSRNYGLDEVLEIQKYYAGNTVKGVSRALVQFDLAPVSKSLQSSNAGGDISTDAKYYLRLYSTEASELPASYTIKGYAISQSWEEGTGKFNSKPEITDGVTWAHTDYRNTNLSWSLNSKSISGSRPGHSIFTNGGGSFYTGSGFESTQTFSYESPDIRMDITDIVGNWITGSNSGPKALGDQWPVITNYGMVVKVSGSLESTGSTDRANLKFFSRNTHTIYPPKIEIVWDDHTGPPSYTSSFTALDMTGNVDNQVYMKGLKPSYKETEVVKFRVGARKRYIQKTFSTSVQTATGSYVADTSGSYSIQDIVTGETIVPFDEYTYLSLDSGSMYFKQDLNTFQPNRIYKILIRVKYDDNQEIIYDDNFEFKVVR